MSELADLIQTFARGITRPDTDEVGYQSYSNAAQNLVWARVSGTTAQRPVGVPGGWTYYDTQTATFVVWSGSVWLTSSVGTGLTAPSSPGDNGKVATAQSGNLTFVDQNTLISSKLRETAGPTTLSMGAVADGYYLTRSGSTVVGTNPATAAARVLRETSGPTDLTLGAVADASFLVRSGATCVGKTEASIIARNLYTTTGPTTMVMGAVADGDVLVRSGATCIGRTLVKGANAPTASSVSNTAITFDTPKRILETGSGAKSLTFSATGAVDGCRVSIFIPANQISSLAIDTSLAPTAAYAVSNFDATAPYLLELEYLVFPSGHECVKAVGYRVTDL